MADKIIDKQGDFYTKTTNSARLSNTVNRSEVQQSGADPSSVNTTRYESQQFYTPAKRDKFDGVRVPIVYGTILTKGVVVDTNTSFNTGDPTTEYKNIKFLMSEGPTEGIETGTTNKEEHVIINQNVLKNSTNNVIELAGVEVKDVNEPAPATWHTSTRVSTKSKDIDIGVFQTGTTNLDQTLRRKRHLTGLADVSGEPVNGSMLRYNSNTKKYENVDLRTVINELPLVVLDEESYGATGDEEKWLLPPSTAKYEVTLADDLRITQSPYRWWKNDSKPNPSVDDTNKGIDYDSDGTRESIHLNGLSRPDILLYEDVTYTFVENGTTIAIRDAAGNAISLTSGGSGIKYFKPTSSTDRILYYGSSAGSPSLALNDGGRIMIKGVFG